MQEQFVSTAAAAEYLGINRRFLLALARRGIAGAYPIGTGEIRHTWVFKLSELGGRNRPQTLTPLLTPAA